MPRTARTVPTKLYFSARSVSYSYDYNPVLRNLSFDLTPNESVAIVGQTGSGKSSAEIIVFAFEPVIPLPLVRSAELGFGLFRKF